MSEQGKENLRYRGGGYLGCCGASTYYTTPHQYAITKSQVSIHSPITIVPNNEEMIDLLNSLDSSFYTYVILDSELIVVFRGRDRGVNLELWGIQEKQNLIPKVAT